MTNISAADGSMSGAKVIDIDLNTCVAGPINSDDGSPYVVPAGGTLDLLLGAGSLGEGEIRFGASNQTGSQTDVMAFDLNRNILVQVTATPNTNEVMFLQTP